MIDAAKRLGIPAASEGFCDRGYTADGNLAKRGEPGALLTEIEAVAKRAVDMATKGVVVALNGTEIPVHADTLCIHSDTPGALDIAKAVNRALEEAGVEVVGIQKVIGLG